MSELDWAGAVAEIGAALGYLKETGAAHVCIAGFCMGGALTLSALEQVEGFLCGACFYGIPRSLDCEKIKVPVQLHFGALDDIGGFSDVQVGSWCENLSLSRRLSVYMQERPKAGVNPEENEPKCPSVRLRLCRPCIHE